ncbi:MAG: hypothetical protein LBF88_00085 [Planctomycetaceae bacterium]|jgi:hypothetical protein|nr:hypothetical protein [Planctomycetaceae bacterium]
MYDSLFKLAVGIAAAVGAYFIANETSKWLTGKHIHQHAYDYLQSQFPSFFKIVETWCQTTADWTSVQLQFIVDDTKVTTRNLLKAVGFSKEPEKKPTIITEEYITPEQARELGFSTEKSEYIELFS